MSVRNEELNRLFIQSTSSHSFVGDVFAYLKKDAKFTYQLLAEKTGFSKSYVHALVMGKKPLTSANYKVIAEAFSLNRDLIRGLKILVEIEQSGWTKEREESLRRIKEKVRSRQTTEELSGFQNPEWLVVYAALGPADSGSSIAEIVQRSGLREEVATQVLSGLEERGIVKKAEGRYFAVFEHIDLRNFSGDKVFERIFKGSLSKIHEKAASSFDDPSHLFFTSVYSVNSKKLPELTKKLNDLLSEYVESTESGNGDRVVLLSSSLIDYH